MTAEHCVGSPNNSLYGLSMRVAVLLSRERTAALRDALNTLYALSRYNNIVDLTFAMYRIPHAAALVDTEFLQRSTLAVTLGTLIQTVPVLVLAAAHDIDATFTAIGTARTSATRVVAAEASAVLFDVQQFLAARQGDNPRAVVIAALQPRLAGLPSPLRSTIYSLIERGRNQRSASGIAQQCGINPRTADRSMSAVGLGSIRRILVVAQAIRAYELLQDPRLPLGRVASHIGFTAIRPAEKIVRAVTGERMYNLRRSPDFARFLPNIVEYLSAPSTNSQRATQSSSRIR